LGQGNLTPVLLLHLTNHIAIQPPTPIENLHLEGG
jgi:hypothetical protein